MKLLTALVVVNVAQVKAFPQYLVPPLIQAFLSPQSSDNELELHTTEQTSPQDTLAARSFEFLPLLEPPHPSDYDGRVNDCCILVGQQLVVFQSCCLCTDVFNTVPLKAGGRQ